MIGKTRSTDMLIEVQPVLDSQRNPTTGNSTTNINTIKNPIKNSIPRKITRDNISEVTINTYDGITQYTPKCLLLELPTGFGKTKVAIDLTNHIDALVHERDLYHRPLEILLLVAKRVHKQTWADEITKWGGFHNIVNLKIECYESLHKYQDKCFDCVILDECFRGDVEILTSEGYKRFDSLRGDELVAQFTDNGNIEFVKPLRFIKRIHNGEICKWHLGRERYCYLTPNHNQVYCTKSISQWRVKPIKDLNRNHISYIPVSGKGSGNNICISPLEQLMIAIQADGALSRHQKNESVYSIQVFKDRKKERLKSILSKTGNYTQIKGRPGSDRYLIKLPKGDAKLLSTHFDINMGYDRANSFIDEILQWDGSFLGGNSVYYSSKIKENADFVSAVAVQAGYKVLQSIEQDNRKDSYSDIHRVFMRKLEKISTQPMKKEYIPYNDYVYCVEVPSHKIVVRSEGYSFISGNCQHAGSDIRLELLKSLTIKEAILGLSATIPRNLKSYFRFNYHAQIIKTTLQEAFDTDTLPEPKIYLIPLVLNEIHKDQDYIINRNKGYTTTEYYDYNERWRARNTPRRAEIHIICTQREYYTLINEDIEYYKRCFMSTRKEFMKNKWLKACGDRLKWLSSIKVPYTLRVLSSLKDKRTLTFCNSIEQTELLGSNCIHSKNKTSQEVLDRFNEGKIKHITSCQMLNEGVNLKNCQVGIYSNLNASEIITRQRFGRILRHKKPIVIIPYYINTREQELVNKMISEYDKNLVETLDFNTLISKVKERNKK